MAHRDTLARRNTRAKAEGWSSYGQRRYWTARWSRQTAERLAAKVCHGHKEESRKGSIMCSECNSRVNPNTKSGGERREGDWRARLVNAANQKGQ